MMKNRKKLLVAASIAGLMASSSIAMAGAAFPGQDSMKRTCCCKNKCSGKGSCKGKHGCPSKAAVAGAAETATQVQDGKVKA